MKKLFSLLVLASFSVFADPININQADADVISKALKGVGPTKAAAIVQYRNEHGAFKSAKDLEAVKGIGLKTIQQNEKEIVYGEGVAPTATAGDKKEDKAVQEKKSK